MAAVAILYLLAVVFLCIVPMWKIFTKAGQPGWACLVPIYNLIVLLQVVRKPLWWIVMILIVPIANIIFLILTFNELSKAFGKDAGFTVGLIFLPIIFFPILGYGSAQYQWPTVAKMEVVERKDLE
jgi:hypothetical protein